MSWHERAETPIYDGDIAEDDHVMTVEDFREQVEDGLLIDYDGVGYPARDGKVANNFFIEPSVVDLIPADATHIVWFNR